VRRTTSPRKCIAQSLSISFLLVSSCSSKAQSTDSQLDTKVAVCKHMANEFPAFLPATCEPRDKLTKENGGLFEFQIHLNCGGILSCTWACVPKKRQGPSFKVKHGPWTLCEGCFSKDSFPPACYHDYLPHTRFHGNGGPHQSSTPPSETEKSTHDRTESLSTWGLPASAPNPEGKQDGWNLSPADAANRTTTSRVVQ
jgi:hypothetical protein